MPRIRKGIAYRKLERPYTRVSKYKAKSFIKVSSGTKVVRFESGDLKRKFQYTLNLNSKSSLQIRDNALESARQTSLKLLESTLGQSGFFMKINTYPYHILRENPLASGAGADRVSTGMKLSFGKPIGVALQLKEGERLFSVSVNEQGVDIARKALQRAIKKLPCSFTIAVNRNKTE